MEQRWRWDFEKTYWAREERVNLMDLGDYVHGQVRRIVTAG